MKKNILLFFLIGLINMSSSFSQENKKAIAILKKVSDKVDAYENLKIIFEISFTNKNENINDTQVGELILAKDKFKLTIKGQVIYSNGKTVWTVVTESEEVQITNFEEATDGDFNPNKIFTLYKTGFNQKMISNKKNLAEIALYPKKPKNKSFHRVNITVDKTKNQILKLTFHGKSSGKTTYGLKKIIPNMKIKNDYFTFDVSKAKDFEIIDLRD